MDILYILKNSKLCFGPMSKNVVDTIISISNDKKLPFTFIPSRRQIEWDGGYVNNWTTESFTKYVKEKSNFITIQRDHGGPGQGKDDDDGYKSLEYDCKFFDSIHIDPWKKYQKYEEGLQWTIDMLKFCYEKNSNLYFEIGTEEAIRKFEASEIDKLLKNLKENLDDKIFSRIVFCVIQSGTSLKDGVNTGVYSSNKLIEMIKIVHSYKLLSKEHNGDFMEEKTMKSRFLNSLDSLNIAPELGIDETKIILSEIKDCSKFYDLCFKSGKWKKWVGKDFDIKDQKKLITICGHYVFSNTEFIDIKKEIKDIDIKIIKELNKKITFFIGNL